MGRHPPWQKIANENLEDYLTVDENGYEHPFMFDTVCGKLFAEVYVPPIPENRNSGGTKREKRRNKGLKKVKRVIDGEFTYHYDTSQLKSNMWKFNPSTCVSISCKLHGTSQISGNVLTRIPKQLTSIDMLRNRMLKRSIRKLEKKKRTASPTKP